MRPGSFDAEFQDAWCLNVLAHGLPALPPDLGAGQVVPVSRWVGPTTAAVLHLRQIPSDPGGELENETHVDCFRLIAGQWNTSGGGGGGWRQDSPLTRSDLDADYVGIYGMASSGGCTALYGELGVDAVVAEVEQDGTTTRRPVEAPIGAFVVCAESEKPFTFRAYAADGELLREHHEPVLDLSDFASRVAALRSDALGQIDGGEIVRVRSMWSIRPTGAIVGFRSREIVRGADSTKSGP